MPKPNIILWDIETGFNAVALFSLHDKANENINYANLLSERYLICASWKKLDGKTHHVSVLDDMARFKLNPHDDYVVVKKLHDVLSSADVLVAHNGDRFDLLMFNARAIYHGLTPLPAIPSVDTLKIARKKFRFNSNRLDYLARLLGIGAKMQTSPGLWMRAFQGKVSAIREMIKYSKQDVDVLEKVYYKLRPWADRHPNIGSISGHDMCCPNCGSNNVQRRGYTITAAGKYSRFQCNECGKYSRDKTLVSSSRGSLTDG